MGELYYPIAIKVMTDAGFQVYDLGIVPTPTVQQLVKLQHAAGGIVITASHNPNEWCGLKFIGPSSIFLTPDECKVVYGDLREEEGYTDAELAAVNEKLYQKYPEGIMKHVDTVLGSDIIPIERIRQRHFRVGFNGQNASGNSYIKYLADRLNLELVAFHTEIG